MLVYRSPKRLLIALGDDGEVVGNVRCNEHTWWHGYWRWSFGPACFCVRRKRACVHVVLNMTWNRPEAVTGSHRYPAVSYDGPARNVPARYRSFVACNWRFGSGRGPRGHVTNAWTENRPKNARTGSESVGIPIFATHAKRGGVAEINRRTRYNGRFGRAFMPDSCRPRFKSAHIPRST